MASFLIDALPDDILSFRLNYIQIRLLCNFLAVFFDRQINC